jgi:LPXTG-motif cell wall-anchored protein
LKKFLIALLAALLVVGMMSVAFATTTEGGSGETPNHTGTEGSTILPTVDTNTICDGVHHAYKAINVDPSCEGNATVIYRCSCGDEIRVETPKTALGHMWDDVNVKVVTKGDCMTPGTVIKTCKRCGKTETFTTEGAHSWTEWATVTPATCVGDGLAKRQCTVCEKVEAKKLAATGKHLFADKYVKDQADCENWGTYEAQCTMCGKYFTYKDLGDDDATAIADGTIALKIKARKHNYGPATITAATCQKDGEIVATCQNTTSTAEYKACNHKSVTVIPHTTQAYNPAVQEVTAKYHKLVFVTEVAATKTTKAIGYYKCTVDGCGYKSKEVVEYTGDANAIAKTTSATAGNTTSGTKAPAKSSSSTNKKGVSIPKTNDTTSNLPYVLIAVAFVGLVALVASKRKVNG